MKIKYIVSPNDDPQREENRGSEKQRASRMKLLVSSLNAPFVTKYTMKGLIEEITTKKSFMARVVDDPVISAIVTKRICMPGVPEYSLA